MHRPAQREIMFARFKQPQPEASKRQGSKKRSPAIQSKKRPAVLIQRLIILHDGLMPLPDDHAGTVNKGVSTDTGETISKRKVNRRNPQAVLSEDASLEEHGEFILYYYNHTLHSKRVKGENTPANMAYSSSGSRRPLVNEKVHFDYCTEEAVKFAGLCRALRSLPLAIRPQNASDCNEYDETEFVHLSDSTLVFVPLELDGDVLAVVQIPRASNDRQTAEEQQQNTQDNVRKRSCVGYGADPTALHESLRRCHALFSMMYGGGIHRRLLRTKQLEKSNEWCIEDGDRSSNGTSKSTCKNLSPSCSDPASYCYGGMKELFRLRHDNRKLNGSSDEAYLMGRNSWRRKSDPLAAFEEIGDQLDQIACQDQINALLKILPITSLRKDMYAYYDRWISKMQGVCQVIEGGVGRCIVEMVPTPLRRDTTRGQLPPVSHAPFVSLAATELMRSLLSDGVSAKSTEFQLSGMSFFYQTKYVSSEFCLRGKSKQTSLSPETVCMIAEQFLQYQNRENEPKYRVSKIATASASNPSHHTASNISARSNTSKRSERNGTSHATNKHDVHQVTGFVFPPRSSNNINGVNAANSFYIDDFQREIWLPRFYITHLLDESIEDDHDLEISAAMFTRREFSFLLFFMGQPSDNKLASTLLSLLDNQLSGFCSKYPSIDINASVSSSSVSSYSKEPGMDIIFIDREDNSCILLSQHDLSTDDFHERENKIYHNDNNNLAKGIFGLGFKIKENIERENAAVSLFSKPSVYMNMLDCRHKLAAYLPLDVMLAFDDMFNEIGRLGYRYKTLRVSNLDLVEERVRRDRTVELCTYLPQGWVYGRACTNRELYIMLDTSKFVTISDVMKAVTRVRENLLSDSLA
eukprot:scaffold18584_cov79-Cyclotella_meneghiniana.AAC.7